MFCQCSLWDACLFILFGEEQLFQKSPSLKPTEINEAPALFFFVSSAASVRSFQMVNAPTNFNCGSKVLSTHLWNFYHEAIKRDSFHNCVWGLPGGVRYHDVL